MRPATRKKKKKKTTKKKSTAVKKNTDPSEFDDWAEEQKEKHRGGCHTCRQPGVRRTIQALLESVIRHKVYKFSTHDMRERILKKHPDADVGQRGLERHLRTCERALYFRARGRRDG